MKKLLLTLSLLAGISFAQAPIPLTIDSRAPTAPGIDPYQASRTVYRVTFTDGTNPVSLTSLSPWMSWSSNSYATAISTASATVVSSAGGIVDFTFTASALNPTFGPGRYLYEVGLRATAGITVYRQGVLTLRGSPYAAGVSPATWTTNAVNWGTINWIGLPTTLAGYGIVDGVDLANLLGVSNQTVQVQSNLTAHQVLTGTNVHGLGTASTHAHGDYATAAQGALASTALQGEADTSALAQLSSHAGLTGTNAHGLGSASLSAASAFATSAQGTKADTALQSESDTNALAQLVTHTNKSAVVAHSDLGTAATNPATAFATAAQGTTANTAAVNASNALAAIVVLSNRTDSTEGATNALNISVVSLKSATNSMTVRIASTESATNALQSQVTALQGSTNALNVSVVNLRSATNSLNARMGTAETDITSLESATGAQQVAIGSLQSATNALNTRAASLESATNSMTVRIAANSGATNALNTRMGLVEGATNSLASDVTELKASTNALQSQTTLLQGGTNALQVQVTALKGATNSLNSRSANWDTAYGWGDHASAGYLSSFTNRFSDIYSANLSALASNISGMSGVYTGALTSVAYTSSVPLVIGRTYAYGYSHIDSGTSTLSIAGASISKTVAGNYSNFFVFNSGASTSLVIKLDGTGLAICNSSNIYVQQITNGNITAAGDLSIGGNMYLNGGLFSSTGFVQTNDVSVTNARPWDSPNYNTITNPPSIPTTNGFVDASITNDINSRIDGLTNVYASTGAVGVISADVDALKGQTSGWVTVTVTNGVNARVDTLTNGASLGETALQPAVTSTWGFVTTSVTDALNAVVSTKASTNDLTAHTTNTANPHAVTAAQVGAVGTNDDRYLAALTNETYLGTLTNVVVNDVTGTVANGVATLTISATGGSGFPLTNDVDLAGYSMTNGAFFGDGAGLTNIAGIETNVVKLAAGTNINLRSEGGTNFIDNSYTFDDAALQGATNSLNTRMGAVENATGVLNIAVGDLRNATNAINTVANAALPKTFTNSAIVVEVRLPVNGIVYFGTTTNYIQDQGGTNFLFKSGIKSANFNW